ncbi:putative ribonuclease 3 [Diaporthe ampelina]|uniref:Putative ribonuclease 3 n=1 Tax=Diaporthe ampelina TaxID=1214573 RepID=A0A0G2IFV8_9PEZI|nr:putative ribonuclease 3 [Diaporthe ampelina]
MGKRPRPDVFASEVSEQPAQKKMRVPDALSRLSESADDLIECLQALKTHSDDSKLTRRLAALSNDLMPSFKVLAKGHDGKVTEEESKATEPPKPEPTEHLQPEVPILTPWRPSEVAKNIPTLPAILDPGLEKASFTHAGATTFRGERSYEQLEWLGDAYLYLMSTAYIYMTFPHLPHGDMCHIREVLVRNSTLGEYSIHYGFEKRAIFPKEYDISGRQGGSKATEKERAKVLGDIFEAHVAAIILSDPIRGVSRTANWLKKLWSTTISQQIKKHTQPQPSLVAPVMGAAPPAGPQPEPKSAKQQLAVLLALSNPRVTIVYRSIDESRTIRDPLTNHALFKQAVFLEGYGETKQLGTGTAKKKSDANDLAAQNALENKKLMNTYKEKKRLALESREAQEKASKDLGF